MLSEGNKFMLGTDANTLNTGAYPIHLFRTWCKWDNKVSNIQLLFQVMGNRNVKNRKRLERIEIPVAIVAMVLIADMVKLGKSLRDNVQCVIITRHIL